ALAQDGIEAHRAGEEQPRLVSAGLGAALVGLAQRLAVGAGAHVSHHDDDACHVGRSHPTRRTRASTGLYMPTTRGNRDTWSSTFRTPFTPSTSTRSARRWSSVSTDPHSSTTPSATVRLT